MIKRVMAEYWDEEFLKDLNEYTNTEYEHDLISSIEGAIELALHNQGKDFFEIIENCMTYYDGNKIDKKELYKRIIGDKRT